MIKVGVLALLLVGSGLGVEMVAQKRPLDLEACLLWKRADLPEVSPTVR